MEKSGGLKRTHFVSKLAAAGNSSVLKDMFSIAQVVPP